MIPYFQFTIIPIGPLIIQVWGLMVAMGILSGILFTYKVGKKYQLSSDFIFDLALWSILGGILGARFFHVVFYDFSFYRSNPGEIVAFGTGECHRLVVLWEQL
jgi:phosphatidylglycerol:prolipoprotein diacylglycerol transferase